MEEMTFKEYLHRKNIASDAFKTAETDWWHELEQLFGQLHPNSFEMQKKFLINDLRRKYPLQVYTTTQ